MFETTKRSSLDRGIGELSYPLYLSHGLVAGLIYYRWGAPKGVLADELATIALCLMVAYLFRIAVDDKVEIWRKRFSEPGRKKADAYRKSATQGVAV
jgi:peptidoglycan/LPS O-acetylase OafA/YrhL